MDISYLLNTVEQAPAEDDIPEQGISGNIQEPRISATVSDNSVTTQSSNVDSSTPAGRHADNDSEGRVTLSSASTSSMSLPSDVERTLDASEKLQKVLGIPKGRSTEEAISEQALVYNSLDHRRRNNSTNVDNFECRWFTGFGDASVIRHCAIQHQKSFEYLYAHVKISHLGFLNAALTTSDERAVLCEWLDDEGVPCWTAIKRRELKSHLS